MATITEITSWLRKDEEKFMKKLSEIGIKRGLGLHKIVDDRVVRDVTGGEFVGDGLCYLTSGAIEMAISQQFGDKVRTSGAILAPISKNTGKYAEFAHNILRVTGGDGKVTVDATWRQLYFKARNRIYIFPTCQEDLVYGGRQIKFLSQGESWRFAKENLCHSRDNNVTLTDFEELVRILTNIEA